MSWIFKMPRDVRAMDAFEALLRTELKNMESCCTRTWLIRESRQKGMLTLSVVGPDPDLLEAEEAIFFHYRYALLPGSGWKVCNDTKTVTAFHRTKAAVNFEVADLYKDDLLTTLKTNHPYLKEACQVLAPHTLASVNRLYSNYRIRSERRGRSVGHVSTVAEDELPQGPEVETEELPLGPGVGSRNKLRLVPSV